MKRDYGTNGNNVGPQASSVLVLKMRLAWKTSTLEACGPTLFPFVP